MPSKRVAGAPEHIRVIHSEADFGHFDTGLQPRRNDAVDPGARATPRGFGSGAARAPARAAPALVEHLVQRQRIAAVADRRQQVDAVERCQQPVAVQSIGALALPPQRHVDVAAGLPGAAAPACPRRF